MRAYFYFKNRLSFHSHETLRAEKPQRHIGQGLPGAGGGGVGLFDGDRGSAEEDEKGSGDDGGDGGTTVNVFNTTELFP